MLTLTLATAGTSWAGAPLTLVGTISDEAGRPLASAQVSIYTAEPRIGLGSNCPSCYPECAKKATTDRSGRFVLPGLDDRLLYRVLVLAPGRIPLFVDRVDPAGRPMSVTLLKRDTTAIVGIRTVIGHVVGPEGERVAGATISTRGIGTAAGTMFGEVSNVNARIESGAITDAGGEFRLSGPDSIRSWVLFVQARGHSPKVFSDVVPGGSGALLKLERGTLVTGVITNSGQPVTGGGVALSMVDQHSFSYAPTDTIATDERGRFTFVNVPASQDYALSSVIGSMGPWTVRTVVRTVGENDSTTELPPIAVEGGYRLRGRVVTSDGAPIPAGTQLTLGRTLLANNTTLPLRADGSFELDGLPPETVTLMIRLKGYHVSPRSQGFVGSFLPGVRIPMLRDQLEVLIVLEPNTPSASDGSPRP